ncbi:TERF1-interacting nuclear factor 2 [Spea bombifrons]|uniref:TERF1-interacting nuclear factor 2 n=1 Tax=Spea bombifrons TaxID=233779 RepID=UPI00234BD2DA|nr:TERF1-interacting nuclear factor 2 [Spea bombifrons]
MEPALNSDVAITAAACWHVLSARKFSYFPKILDFLECIYRTAPDLFHYRHYAKLSLGLRARILLDLIAQNGTDDETWKTFQKLFPKTPSDAVSYATHRDIHKVQSANASFRSMVKRLFEDDEFRKNYMKEQVALEYGEPFVAMLEKLLRELLVRLNTALSKNNSKQLMIALERYLPCTQVDDSIDMSL